MAENMDSTVHAVQDAVQEVDKDAPHRDYARGRRWAAKRCAEAAIARAAYEQESGHKSWRGAFRVFRDICEIFALDEDAFDFPEETQPGAAEEKITSDWVSVEDYLPVEMRHCFLVYTDRKNTYSAFLDAFGWCHFGNGSAAINRTGETVTHWRKTPDAPQT